MVVEAPVGLRLTPVQRRRRQRIIECAIALAAEGGYDAVQMRTVAARSGVALGTLYRYFTSKEHLLVSAMALQVSGLRARMTEKPPRGDDAAGRVMDSPRRSRICRTRQVLRHSPSPGAEVGAIE